MRGRSGPRLRHHSPLLSHIGSHTIHTTFKRESDGIGGVMHSGLGFGFPRYVRDGSCRWLWCWLVSARGLVSGCGLMSFHLTRDPAPFSLTPLAGPPSSTLFEPCSLGVFDAILRSLLGDGALFVSGACMMSFVCFVQSALAAFPGTGMSSGVLESTPAAPRKHWPQAGT